MSGAVGEVSGVGRVVESSVEAAATLPVVVRPMGTP